jgi:hypothetical protein
MSDVFYMISAVNLCQKIISLLENTYLNHYPKTCYSCILCIPLLSIVNNVFPAVHCIVIKINNSSMRSCWKFPKLTYINSFSSEGVFFTCVVLKTLYYIPLFRSICILFLVCVLKIGLTGLTIPSEMSESS